MTRHPTDTPQFYLTAPSPCPYLPGQQERKVFTHLVGSRARTLNDVLTQGGFRRSQNIAYRPACERCQACVSIRIRVDGERPEEEFCSGLKQVLEVMPEGCPVVLDFYNSVARCDIRLGDSWRVNPSDELLQELRYAYGDESVELVFN